MRRLAVLIFFKRLRKLPPYFRAGIPNEFAKEYRDATRYETAKVA